MPSGIYIRTNFHKNKIKQGHLKHKGQKMPQMARKNGELHFGKYIQKGFLAERNILGLHPHKRGEYKHTQETKDMISRKNKGKKRTKKQIEKMRKIRKLQIMKPRGIKTILKLRKAGIRRMLREQKQKKKDFTSIEKKLYTELEKRNIIFEKQKVINNRFIVDAFIPSKNLIIEVDGKFWHSIDRVIKKDKAENAYLLKCGYKLLRIPEQNIQGIERMVF